MMHNGQPDWDERLESKVKSAVSLAFGIEDFRIKPFSMDGRNKPAFMTDRFFSIESLGSTLGYIYVAQAPSMKNIFDYLIAFDTNLTIVKAKILIYREQHGRQIGARRWLDQFVGHSTGDRLVLGDNIDAISGATISATSMTKAVDSLLDSLSAYNTLDSVGYE